MSFIWFVTMLLNSSAMRNPAASENMSYCYLLQVGEFLRYPCIKFIGHTMSFIGFLTMLLTSSAMENPAAPENMSFFKPHYDYYTKFRQEAVVKELETSNLPTDFRIRAFQPQVINMILSLWILGK